MNYFHGAAHMRVVNTHENLPALHARQNAIWAKCVQNGRQSDPDAGWMPLWRHLDDTGMVAGRLWDAWLSTSVKRLIGSALGGESAGRSAVVWLAAAHDVGKASPSFSTLVPALAKKAEAAGLSLNGVSTHRGPEHSETRHELVSYLAMREWLIGRHGATRLQSRVFASILGAHHGLAPDSTSIQQSEKRPAYTGTVGGWAGAQEELLERAAQWSGASDHIRSWLSTDIPQHVLVVLSGIVIMSDWIASDENLFPYETTSPAAHRIDVAWERLNLPDKWEANAPEGIPADLFRSRFDLPAGATLRPAQADMVTVAQQLAGPGMIILEAPMGEGKTEAALAAAEIMATRSGLSGCMVVLPTMATSDGMFKRVIPWAGRAGVNQDRLSVYLAHSKSQLNEQNSFMLERSSGSIAPDEDSPAGLGSIPAGLVAHEWLQQGRKRGILSSFVVGTVDQLLFGALKTKHLNLRHLALAQKVIVIDEAHAYDVFMTTYLDRALHWLGAYGAPVIVLSATLPEARRIEMLSSYESGQRGEEHRSRNALRSRYDHLRGNASYPLLSYLDGSGAPRQLAPAASGRSSTVAIDRIGSTVQDVGDYLATALVGGGCAAVIHNTVGRVQGTATYLRKRFPGVDVSVAHSRFLAADRAGIDRDLIRRFGDDPKTQGLRPRASIVVASQVIEQSLDVDFDVMVSDLAPVDLLLQRAGRLHRHDRGTGSASQRPAQVGQPRLAVTGADWSASPVEPTFASTYVYDRHLLYRTAAVLDGRTALHLPADITPLVQSVYGPATVGPAGWQPAMGQASTDFLRKMLAKEEAAKDFVLESIPFDDDASLVNWAKTGAGEADETPAGQAKVRDTEPSLEVVAVFRHDDGTIRTPDWFPGQAQLVAPGSAYLPGILSDCSIRLPLAVCRDGIEKIASHLQAACRIPWWQTDRRTRYLHPLEFVKTNGTWTAACGQWTLTYSSTKGLEHANL